MLASGCSVGGIRYVNNDVFVTVVPRVKERLRVRMSHVRASRFDESADFRGVTPSPVMARHA